MDCLYNELINILDNEIATYNDIYKISKEKTDIIVEGKVSELEKIVQAEQQLILRVTQIENQRETIIFKISRALKLKSEEITLTTLIEIVQGDLGEKLRSQQESLSKLVKELTNLNDLNSKLIRNSLDYINFSLNLFANSGTKDNNYGIDAEKSSSKASSMFDFKI
ncbi:MAG: flagellar protein FlgN [Bacillota bacterium]|nr:flagellar protein FlgN [Bacillota bacterium]